MAYQHQVHLKLNVGLIKNALHKDTGIFSLFNVPFTKVELVGTIVGIFGTIVNIPQEIYKVKIDLDDSTGMIHCTIWELPKSQIDKYTLGTPVRIFGRVKAVNNQIELNISDWSDICVLTDPNAEVYHWLQVIDLCTNVYNSSKPLPTVSLAEETETPAEPFHMTLLTYLNEQAVYEFDIQALEQKLPKYTPQDLTTAISSLVKSGYLSEIRGIIPKRYKLLLPEICAQVFKVIKKMYPEQNEEAKTLGVKIKDILGSPSLKSYQQPAVLETLKILEIQGKIYKTSDFTIKPNDLYL